MWYRWRGRYCHGQVSGKNSAEAGAHVLPRFSSGKATLWTLVRGSGTRHFGTELTGPTQELVLGSRIDPFLNPSDFAVIVFFNGTDMVSTRCKWEARARALRPENTPHMYH